MKPDHDIALKNLGLARKWAQKFTSRRAEFDDLVAEGYIALAKSSTQFDPDRGVKFSTYGSRAVINQLVRYTASVQTVPIPPVVYEKRSLVLQGKPVDLDENMRERIRLAHIAAAPATVGTVGRFRVKDQGGVADFFHSHAGSDPGFQRVDDQDEWEYVLTLIDRLPPTKRKYLLATLEHGGIREAAKALGQKPDTIKQSNYLSGILMRKMHEEDQDRKSQKKVS